ncbi:hypothetical protein CR513_03825, partial [Mucuna pruriens]
MESSKLLPWSSILKAIVLWSYHTTPHSATEETPFCLTFGTNAMISTKIEEALPQVSLFQNKNNEVELKANMDLLQEEREMAHIQECSTKATVARRYNMTIFPRLI